ncbi:DUF1801 domain-containing protein [Mucilaginibacter sp. 44-25]|nr:DUF1801 domain-containing protein [Mucilaginibacter sp. 44-25]OJW17618.1 MAG: hypothetical protein BGO48_08785 [Mucilaginibacter sp. 44-25]PLW91503.1 MAG: hypothetical protein C0154_00900 [Mucilaginibacter sp.]HEK20948.1 hypothetical protein [Bacteroidota bacterium]
MKKPADTNIYIASFPDDIRIMLEELRHTIIQAAPHATEIISYGMPAYKQHGVLVYFAAQSKHIGFYPGAKAIEVFANELTPYDTSKGTIRFCIDAPLPLELVTRITQFRVKDDQALFELKKAKKSKK